jgi:hypothetical protein
MPVKYITAKELDTTRYEIKDNKIFSKMINDFIKPHYSKKKDEIYFVVTHNSKNHRILLNI